MSIATGSILMFALAPVYPLVLLANSLWAVGITFISGAELALFYDTLRELGREAEYPKYLGRLQAIVLGSMAISSVLGGVIGEFSLASTFTITAGVMVIATGFVVLLKEPPREPDKETGQHPTYLETLRVTFGALREQPNLRYALFFSSIIPLLGGTIQVTFIQPYAIAVELPVAALGVIALGVQTSQIAGSICASRTVRKFGEVNWLRIAPLVITAGVISLGLFNSVVSIILFALTGFASAVTGPLVESIILRQTSGSVRATILSVDSLFYQVLLALIGPVIGLIADRSSLPAAFVGVGTGFGIVLLSMLLLWARVYKQPPSSQAA
jgi:hypothetical protein